MKLLFLQVILWSRYYYFSIQHYYAILVRYKDWGGDLEICRSILWANASAGAETLDFGKGSSDDERLNKTVIGSTNKLISYNLFMILSLEVIIFALWICGCDCPASRAHYYVFNSFFNRWTLFVAFKLTEKLLFNASQKNSISS